MQTTTAHPAINPLFGRFTIEALPLHEPIVVATFCVVALGGIAVLAGIT